MKEFDYKKVEEIIGYKFNNKMLLKQAFIRSAYAHENNCESNEVLEFAGDRALEVAVIKLLFAKYSKGNKKEKYFKCEKQEGELTSIKSEIVNTKYLANAIDKLELNKYIYYGKSDINNNAKNSASIKEDLFEAIVGAVAIDTNWDVKEITNVVSNILFLDDYFNKDETSTNYTGLAQEKAAEFGLKTPTYKFEQVKRNGQMVWKATASIKGLKFQTSGFGVKQKDAKKNAAFEMLAYLKDNEKTLKNMNQSQNDPLAIINSLVQAGEITKPYYEYEQEYDRDGNPVWRCDVDVEEFDCYYSGYGSSKREAQRDAVNEFLDDILEDR